MNPDDTDELIRTLLARASVSSTTSQERRLLALVAAHLDGDRDRVDALARDHLADHPDDVLAALVAALSHHTSDPQEKS